MASIRAKAITWYHEHRRDLPWRDPQASAWSVLVSEVMLQQTPVKRVLPVWLEWMDRWPTPEDLASESAAEVIKAWGSLGYPRRALRLQQAAAAIVDSFGGQVPANESDLLSLPGIGTYTAAAVAAFSFGQRTCVVDTNIRRVHARVFTGRALPEPTLRRSELDLAAALLPDDAAESVEWNIASMELGALVCTARSPHCLSCPLVADCAWIQAGEPEPHYTPKGQAWQGTNRQLRGALMSALRAGSDYVPLTLFLGESGDSSLSLTVDEEVAAAHVHSLERDNDAVLGAIQALISEGLVQSNDDSTAIRLPR